MDIFEKCFKPQPQEKIREMGIYTFFKPLETKQDTEVIMEGKRRIMLGSNNYLGLTTHPDIIEKGAQTIKTLGTGCSGSRFLNGTLNIHLELERELASFLNKDRVITFSTGFQTNLGIISAIVGKDDYVIMDRENHASLYDGCRLSLGHMLRFKHNDMEDLENKLKRVPQNCGILIVTDGVFSMSGDVANLPEICRLAKQYGARVMVDDSHSLGVIGKGGRGAASHFNLEDEVDIYMGTFSKSLASVGGYMAASERVIDYVSHVSRPFIFSASLPPVNAATALAALRHMKEHPELTEMLQENAIYMRKRLNEQNIRMKNSVNSDNGIIPIIPIYTYEMIPTFKIAHELFEEGVFVNTVLPPATAPNECLLRISLMATHTHELIDEAVEKIRKILNENNIH